MSVFGGMQACTWFGVHVQFETVRHHDYGLRAVPILGHCEFKRLSSVDEETAPQAAGVLDNPVAAAVFADQERTARRGRFTFAHGIIPLVFLVAKDG
jgi:hypothetical protein